MAKPSIPYKINENIKEISTSTWNRLIDCLAYAMDHPRGDGQNIILDASNGILRFNERKNKRNQTGCVHRYTKRAFDVKINIEEGTFYVNGGWVLHNDECFTVPGKTFNLQYGHVSIGVALPKDHSKSPFLVQGPLAGSEYVEYFYTVVVEIKCRYDSLHVVGENDFLIFSHYVMPHFISYGICSESKPYGNCGDKNTDLCPHDPNGSLWKVNGHWHNHATNNFFITKHKKCPCTDKSQEEKKQEEASQAITDDESWAWNPNTSSGVGDTWNWQVNGGTLVREPRKLGEFQVNGADPDISSFNLGIYGRPVMGTPGAYWRIVEVGEARASSGEGPCTGVRYNSGTIDENGFLVGLPDSFRSSYGYTGYMELQQGIMGSNGEIIWPC